MAHAKEIGDGADWVWGGEKLGRVELGRVELWSDGEG